MALIRSKRGQGNGAAGQGQIVKQKYRKRSVSTE